MKNKNTLLHDILHFVDAFAEYSSMAQFVLAAMPAVMSGEDGPSPDTLAGARICAETLQSRTRQLKQSMNQILDRYRAEHGNAGRSDD